MADSIRDREYELLTYLRNNITDPSGRGTSKTDTLTATAGQTTFTLTQTLVKNIVSVSVDAVTQYIGYAFTVAYGEGTAATTITLRTACTVGQSVVIVYRYGSVMVYEGFQRLDSELPRMSVVPNRLLPEFMSIGEDSNGAGNSQWLVGNYTIVIRSRFAKQIKDMSTDVFNKINQMRQTTPQQYKVLIVTVDGINPEDFDNELRLYESKITFTIKWHYKFK